MPAAVKHSRPLHEPAIAPPTDSSDSSGPEGTLARNRAGEPQGWPLTSGLSARGLNAACCARLACCTLGLGSLGLSAPVGPLCSHAPGSASGFPELNEAPESVVAHPSSNPTAKNRASRTVNGLKGESSRSTTLWRWAGIAARILTTVRLRNFCGNRTAIGGLKFH
jgi:hypothetical protein